MDDENALNLSEVRMSAESGRPMRRGIRPVTIAYRGQSLTYDQPGWWCALATQNPDPSDDEGELEDEDNVVADAAFRALRERANQGAEVSTAVRADSK